MSTVAPRKHRTLSNLDLSIRRLLGATVSAVKDIGTGALRNKHNTALLEASGGIDVLYHEIVAVTYRLLMLLIAEDRKTLFPHTTKKNLVYAYASKTSVSRLRKPVNDENHWKQLCTLFDMLNTGDSRSGVPQLSGIFNPRFCKTLSLCQISDAYVLKAIRSLTFVKDTQLDYISMPTEVIGGVHECLLGLHPVITENTFSFQGDERDVGKGSDRKLTGSYYTPESLVQELIRSTLTPVLKRVQKERPDDVATAVLKLKVCDPSCGSGNFLLAAARHIAAFISQGAEPEVRQKAQWEVTKTCIYGIDRTELSVELCKIALWVDAAEPGASLAHFDTHIKCGDSLIGASPEGIKRGIHEDLFSVTIGDDRQTCSLLKRRNREQSRQHTRINVWQPQHADGNSIKFLADLWCAAFMVPKTSVANNPITETTFRRVQRDPLCASEELRTEVERLTTKYKFFHWYLEFPDVFTGRVRNENMGWYGGFDVILGNPPWEVSRVSEVEFFASRIPEVSELEGNDRRLAIASLRDQDTEVWQELTQTRRQIATSNRFYKLSGHYPLTTNGVANTYSLFSELILNITSREGRAGFIVPSGIVADITTRKYFEYIHRSGSIISLVDFSNTKALFPAISTRLKFSLVTLGRSARNNRFMFYATNANHVQDVRRQIILTPTDIDVFNPNTCTAPLFRSKDDLALSRKIYDRFPILARDNEPGPWGIHFGTTSALTGDTHRTYASLMRQGATHEGTDLRDATGVLWAPLFEGKMIHQYNYRWASYSSDGTSMVRTSLDELRDPDHVMVAKYYLPRDRVEQELHAKGIHSHWLFGWRGICCADNERTSIIGVIPRVGSTGHLPSFTTTQKNPRMWAALLGNFNSLVYDYTMRQKLAGAHLTGTHIRQVPVLPPEHYTNADLKYIVPRIVELVYVGNFVKPFADEMGYKGASFRWHTGRRRVLRAELDAYYAKLYGLSREEIMFILDPTMLVADHPSETFRVLRDREIRNFGEYRTARMVLEAFDQL